MLLIAQWMTDLWMMDMLIHYYISNCTFGTLTALHLLSKGQREACTFQSYSRTQLLMAIPCEAETNASLIK